MRIAVWHNLPSGGGKRALFNHVQGLLALGHTVEAWCPPTADQSYLPLSTLVPEHVLPMDWPVPERASDFWQVTLHSGRKLQAMEAHCRACADQIDRGRFDILFANACEFFRTTPIGRLARTPAVLYLGEPYRWLYEALPRLPWLAPPRDARPLWHPRRARSAFSDLRRQRNLRLQARHELDDAAAFRRILVNSYFSRESVLRAYGLDSTVCYLGIDHTRFRFAEAEREDFVVSLGAVTPEKNACFIIEALALLPEPRPRLVWVGNFADGDYGRRSRALAAERGVVFDVRVRVSDEELQDLLGRARLMAYAPRLEPFGLAPLEANACGTPVVAVAEGGVRETVVDGETGLLVDGNPVSMAAAIGRLRDDPALARRLGRQARDAVVARWGLPAASLRLEAELLRYADLLPVPIARSEAA